MEALEFLESAKEILSKEHREINSRNAASRAYYCAFHSCKKLLQDFPPKESQRGAEHEKIIAELLNHQNKQFKILGNMLKTSKDQRARADYKLADKFSIQDAKRVVLSTEKLLEELEKIYSK
jgi:uncharacterized protein (UPF0332 family)